MEQAKPKKPKLTVKQAKLVQGVVAGKTKRQAAKDAGYSGSPETLSVTASEVLKKPNVQEALQIALEKHNITPDRIMEVVSNGLDAQKVVIVGKGDDAFADLVDDHPTRLKAAGMAANFMGLNQKVEGTTNYNFINVQKQDKDEFGI